MFEISRKADYATRIMIELACEPPEIFVSANYLSRKTSVPKPFLHKIVGELTSAQLIQTQSGPRGGVRLGQAAEDVSLLDVLEAVEGPICINTCLSRPQECPRDRTCPAHGVFGRLQSSIVSQLQSVSLFELAEEARQLKKHPRPLELAVYLNV